MSCEAQCEGDSIVVSQEQAREFMLYSLDLQGRECIDEMRDRLRGAAAYGWGVVVGGESLRVIQNVISGRSTGSPTSNHY